MQGRNKATNCGRLHTHGCLPVQRRDFFRAQLTISFVLVLLGPLEFVEVLHDFLFLEVLNVLGSFDDK